MRLINWDYGRWVVNPMHIVRVVPASTVGTDVLLSDGKTLTRPESMETVVREIEWALNSGIDLSSCPTCGKPRGEE